MLRLLSCMLLHSIVELLPVYVVKVVLGRHWMPVWCSAVPALLLRAEQGPLVPSTHKIMFQTDT